MLQIQNRTRFNRDVRRARKQGKNIARLFEVVHRIAAGEILPENFRDHALTGDWIGHREWSYRTGLAFNLPN